jgi:HEAT repeat protein
MRFVRREPRVDVLVLIVLCALGCATPAGVLRVRSKLQSGSIASALEVYETLRARHRPEAPEALREIAGATIVRAALAPHRGTRDAAFGALESLGDQAPPLYERILRRGPPPAKARAAEGLLVGDDDDSGVAVLRRALRSSDGEIRAAGVSWLAAESRWRKIHPFLLDLDSAVRGAAARALARARMTPRTVLALREALRVDPSPAVRAAATRALARAGPSVVDALVAALSDPALGVRSAALGALASIQSPVARDRIERIASGEATAEGAQAAAALALSGEPRGIVYLRRSLHSTDAELRRQAIAAGGSLAALRADVVPLLADPEPGVRLRAALALVRVPAERPAAQRVLSALLAAGGAETLPAATALAELGDTRARRRLREALSSPSPSERVLAVHAIGDRLGEPLAVRRSLVDPDPRVRLSAATAILREIGSS